VDSSLVLPSELSDVSDFSIDSLSELEGIERLIEISACVFSALRDVF